MRTKYGVDRFPRNMRSMYRSRIRRANPTHKAHTHTVEDERIAAVRHDLTNCVSALKLRLDIIYHMRSMDETELNHLNSNVACLEMALEDWRRLRTNDSRVVSGTTFSLTDVLLQMVERSRPAVRSKGLSLSVNVDNGSALVTGHESAIRRAIDNVLSNAIKYSREGGVISVSLTIQSGRAVLRIRDNGIGIPADDQRNLFQAYYRAKNADAFSGTGLGLFQVKDAVERDGGSVTLTSQWGTGTEVEMVLPIVAVNAISPTAFR